MTRYCVYLLEIEINYVMVQSTTNCGLVICFFISVYYLSSDLRELLSELSYRSIDSVRDGEWL